MCLFLNIPKTLQHNSILYIEITDAIMFAYSKLPMLVFIA